MPIYAVGGYIEAFAPEKCEAVAIFTLDGFSGTNLLFREFTNNRQKTLLLQKQFSSYSWNICAMLTCLKKYIIIFVWEINLSNKNSRKIKKKTHFVVSVFFPPQIPQKSKKYKTNSLDS